MSKSVRKPTPAQLAFIVDLVKDLGTELPPKPITFDEARTLIESSIASRDAKRQAKLAEKKAAEKDLLQGVDPLEAGRHELSGEVVYAAMRETPYGETPKMIVMDALGRKVWLTVPASVANKFADIRDLRGSSVAGVATLKVKEDDEHFAFGSRPSDFKVVA